MTAIALALPAVMVGNALWLLLGPWLVDVAYAVPGFPDDAGGLDRDARAALAHQGVEAVRPLGPGVDVLREADLPGGEAAFRPAEISHMADVRALVGGFTIAWTGGLAALVVRAARARALRALRAGALATLAAVGAIALFALLASDALFTAFHGVFFEGDSWRFADEVTLRRLYPDEFWGLSGAALGLLVAAQALALAIFAGPRAAARPGRPPKLEVG
jgi:integral membrane protein (TIGR01906 family)